MKRSFTVLLVLLAVAALVPVAATSQDEGTITIRTLPVEYYAANSKGVKIMYRGYDNEQRYIYLPKSFEGTRFRFVMAPKGVSTSGLPALIVRMRDSEVVYIDIYTRYLRSSASIADFDEEDYEQFREAEEMGKIELAF
jgi:hypothetical protein